MKILAIGNSFSQDAMRYLHGIARAGGKEVRAVNLFIGGCSLERHYRNMLSGERAYQLECNGAVTGFSVSLQDALYADAYDAVTLQQVSQAAPFYETYQPYLSALAEQVRRAQPRARLYMHQTWAYEAGSHRLCEELRFSAPEEMLARVRAAYATAAAEVGAEGIIPSGEALYALSRLGVDRVHRDTFHAALGVGRYTLGLVWYGRLMDGDIAHNTFCDFDVPVSSAEIAVAKQAACTALIQECN